MKIRVKSKSYAEVMSISAPRHKRPIKPTKLFRFLLTALSFFDVKRCRVKFNKYGMDRLGKEPALILMNHSCFLDLKIASVLFSDRPFNIVCTSDGFIGKPRLMRWLGCIPTQKFVSDMALVKDMKYTFDNNRCSVLMYPEASYSFDGTATPLPESLGKLIKLFGVPVVTVITKGAFARDPLYNGLQLRRVNVSADVTYLLTPEEIENMSAEQINIKLKEVFSFDNFAWQQQNKVEITENFRADGLNRVLYKCPHCMTEGEMQGEGITLSCKNCGESYVLNKYGVLENKNAVFTHIPDWYAWQRKCVAEEIKNGSYNMTADVDVCMVVDYKAVYRVGSGRLTHNSEGFTLIGCDGELCYSQPPLASYGLYADYFWYEIGDMICIGDKKCLYYCFPKNSRDIVAKTRLATEELYKIKKNGIKKIGSH